LFLKKSSSFTKKLSRADDGIKARDDIRTNDGIHETASVLKDPFLIHVQNESSSPLGQGEDDKLQIKTHLYLQARPKSTRYTLSACSGAKPSSKFWAFTSL